MSGLPKSIRLRHLNHKQKFNRNVDRPQDEDQDRRISRGVRGRGLGPRRSSAEEGGGSGDPGDRRASPRPAAIPPDPDDAGAVRLPGRGHGIAAGRARAADRAGRTGGRGAAAGPGPSAADGAGGPGPDVREAGPAPEHPAGPAPRALHRRALGVARRRPTVRIRGGGEDPVRGVRRPGPEVFAAVDPEPVASASISQVHRAVLLDGRTMALEGPAAGDRQGGAGPTWTSSRTWRSWWSGTSRPWRRTGRWRWPASSSGRCGASWTSRPSAGPSSAASTSSPTIRPPTSPWSTRNTRPRG